MKTKKLLLIVLIIYLISLNFLSTFSISAQTTEYASNKVILKQQNNVQKTNSQTKKFVIKNKKDFSKFMTNSKYWESDYKIKVNCDIDMKGKEFNSWKSNYKIIENFKGHFDGCGHTIKNIKFKCFVKNNHGTISNVKFKINRLFFSKSEYLVMYNEEDGFIDNCSIDMNNEDLKDIQADAGFVIINKGIIKNSETTLFVKSGNLKVGGFVSENYGNIEKCSAKGNVNCIIKYNDIIETGTGGFVGINKGVIAECIATGSVNGRRGTGGFVGNNYYGTIIICTSTGNVNGLWDAGGFVGSNYGTINNCIAKGDVNGEKISLYKFAGWCKIGKIENCKIT